MRARILVCIKDVTCACRDCFRPHTRTPEDSVHIRRKFRWIAAVAHVLLLLPCGGIERPRIYGKRRANETSGSRPCFRIRRLSEGLHAAGSLVPIKLRGNPIEEQTLLYMRECVHVTCVTFTYLINPNEDCFLRNRGK